MKYLLSSFLMILPSVFAETCPAGYAAKNRVYDSSVSTCPNGTLASGDVYSSSSNTDDVCRCTKCSQIEVWMAAEGEVCDDGTWSETTPTCDTVTSCPSPFTLKSNANTTNCKSVNCDLDIDLYTCCESTVEPYDRVPPTDIKVCHASDCTVNGDNNPTKCVDETTDKVHTKCLCKKDSYFKDARGVIAEVGDYCDADGFFDEKEDNNYGTGETRDREQFGFEEKCDKRCQKLYEASDWGAYHALLDAYETRPCRSEGKTGPKCTDPSPSRRMLRKINSKTPMLGITHRTGMNQACMADSDLPNIQKKGFDCDGCKVCKDEIDTYPYGAKRVVYSNPNKPTQPDHGACRPACESAINNPSSNFIANRYCGDDTYPRGTYAKQDGLCFLMSNVTTFVCGNRRKCTGCQFCIDAAKNSTIFTTGFGPARYRDINGDGSRVAGGCFPFCEDRFYWRSGNGYYRKWNDGTDGGDVGSLVGTGATTNIGNFQSHNKSTAPSDICEWESCSGCRACQEWANADDTTIVPGTSETYSERYGVNVGFRFKEPLEDYSGKTHSRKRKNRISGCQSTCKAKFQAIGANMREICTTDECDGCDPCQNPTKYITKFAGQTTKLSIYNKFKRDTGDMVMNDREKYGQEDDGNGGKRVPTNKGNTASNTWARTSTCPGFPKCFAFEGVCETAHCGRCAECVGKSDTEKNHYTNNKPIYR